MVVIKEGERERESSQEDDDEGFPLMLFSKVLGSKKNTNCLKKWGPELEEEEAFSVSHVVGSNSQMILNSIFFFSNEINYILLVLI